MNEAEREQKIVEMYQDGSSIRDIMDACGGADYSIHKVLKKNNVDIRIRKQHNQSGLSEQNKIDIVADYLNKKSITDLSTEYNVCLATIARILSKNNIDIRASKYNIRHDYFEIIDSEEKAYILGFLYADGHNQVDKHKVCLELQERDVEILHKIGDLIYIDKDYKLGSFKGCERIIEGKYCMSGPSKRFYIYSKKICEDLVKLGCGQNKTLKCSFPEIPDHLIRHFIRGYFDGDGSIIYALYKSYFHGKIWICCTPEFAAGLQEKVQQVLDIKIKINKRPTKVIVTAGLQSVKNASIFLKWIYEDANIYLDRKYQKYVDLKRDHKIYIDTFYETHRKPISNKCGQLRIIESDK